MFLLNFLDGWRFKEKKKMDTYKSRRNFLKILGLSSGIMAITENANAYKTDEIIKLTPEQQEFMLNYSKWMDKFIEVIRVQKVDKNNSENNTQLMILSEQAKSWQAVLQHYMTDKNFALIYKVTSERMSIEIE
jgi:hypothetical protein